MILVLADDFSGAAEIAGIASNYGLASEVQTALNFKTTADLIALDAGSRSLTPEQAFEQVHEISIKLVDGLPSWIFKKVDSVLRGHVLPEIFAMVEALNLRGVALLPANPSRNRLIREGRYTVDGVPLHKTLFAEDPEFPVFTDIVAEIVGEAPVWMRMPDVESMEDLAREASSLRSADLPVGGADFFTALLNLRRPELAPWVGGDWLKSGEQPTLYVCGSVASWNEREQSAKENGLPVVIADLERPKTTIDELRKQLSKSGSAMIGLGALPILTMPTSELPRQLANLIRGVLRQMKIARVFCEGGATSAALVSAMNWTRLNSHAGAANGLGVLEPLDHPGLRLFIKPGSYPWPEGVGI